MGFLLQGRNPASSLARRDLQTKQVRKGLKDVRRQSLQVVVRQWVRGTGKPSFIWVRVRCCDLNKKPQDGAVMRSTMSGACGVGGAPASSTESSPRVIRPRDTHSLTMFSGPAASKHAAKSPASASCSVISQNLRFLRRIPQRNISRRKLYNSFLLAR